jgi:hypothetical protein
MLRQHAAPELSFDRWAVIMPQALPRRAHQHAATHAPAGKKPTGWPRLDVCRWFAAMMSASVLALAGATPLHADPVDTPIAPNPYPKDSLVLAAYQHLDPAEYFVPGLYGVYFLSPTGLNCGIWLRGSFGCAGPLPGTPPGTDHIGWFNGDTSVHDDRAIAIGFPAVQAHQVLPPRSYLTWNETTCATTGDNSTFCYRGMFRFFITPNGTDLNG